MHQRQARGGERGGSAYIGVKCSRKQERNRDSARPPNPVTGAAENWCVDDRAPSPEWASRLPFFPSLACCAWSLAAAAKPRGLPSFLLVEYVH